LAEQKRPITAEDIYKISHVEDPRISPDGRWIAYVHMTVDKLENGYKRNIWLAPTNSGEPLQLTRSGKDTQPRWSPDGKTLAFTSARNKKPQIYLLRIGEPGGEARQLTSMPNGANSPAWSPDGSRIAFLAGMNASERAKEDSGEEDTPPVDKLESEQREARKERDEQKRWDPRIVSRIPYRTGTSFLDDRFTQIYVIPVAEGLEGKDAKPRRLTSTDANHEQPQWTPDGQYLLTARMAKPGDDEPWRKNVLFRIRVDNGEMEQLTDENFASLTPLPSPDGRWIAYTRLPRELLAERITRLAVLPTAGGEPRDLNMELDRPVVDFKWTANSSALTFSAMSGGDIEIYKVAPTGGSVEKIIAGTMHAENLDVGTDGSIVYAASTPLNPSELYFQPPGSVPRQLTQVNTKFLDEVIVQPTQELRFTSPGRHEIQGWYLYPVDYQEGKTYPLAFNIHGGPHVMWGPSMRSMWHEWQFHAARGYAVFYSNPRGSDGYGESFIRQLHGKWGDVAFTDLMAGIDTLLQKGFVDPNRMAVTGGSYGGYMTAWIVSHTDRFTAAVSQRGVYNLLTEYSTSDIPSFVEDELGVSAWQEPMALWEHSPLAHAHKIKTPLLLIHSENDYRVPIAEAEQLFTFVRRTGGTVQMVRFPREGHELTRSGEPEHRVSSLTHMIEWFDKYCKPEGQ
jgi:dipeptidyl aminopeptidase/acylaminoacyl peptidase